MKTGSKWMSLMIMVFMISSANCQQKVPTAGKIIDQIKEKVGLEWAEGTVDTYKGGHSEMKVTGIATTFLATMDVLKRAKEKGLNLIITHEPTYYNHLDDTEPLKNDPVQQEKRQFIADNHLVVWRFHDYWHQMNPDGIYKGVFNKLGWESFSKNGSDRIFEIPPTSVGQLSGSLEKIFDAKTIRVVGSPDASISKVGLVLGAAGSSSQIQMLERDDVEVIIIGETREWETVEYVRDAISQNRKKALIIIGHANSEEAGMSYCAEWLKTFIDEVPIEFVPAGDPFWEP